MPVLGIDPDTALAPRHPEEPAIVHDIEELRGGARRAAPVVLDRPVVEMRVDLARVHGTALAHELQQLEGASAPGGAPGTAALSRARMHQRLERPRDE